MANTILSHFVESSDQMYFLIYIQDIDLIMKTLLLDPEDEDDTVKGPLTVFDAQCDEDFSVNHNRAHIKNLKLFKLVIGLVALGLLFVSSPDRMHACARSCRYGS